MDVLKGIFALVYVVIFFISVFIVLKFEWSKEGRDERGRQISSQSYAIALPMIPLAWLILELTNDYVYEFTYDQYKHAIWFVVTGVYILLALLTTIFRRRV